MSLEDRRRYNAVPIYGKIFTLSTFGRPKFIRLPWRRRKILQGAHDAHPPPDRHLRGANGLA